MRFFFSRDKRTMDMLTESCGNDRNCETLENSKGFAVKQRNILRVNCFRFKMNLSLLRPRGRLLTEREMMAVNYVQQLPKPFCWGWTLNWREGWEYYWMFLKLLATRCHCIEEVRTPLYVMQSNIFNLLTKSHDCSLMKDIDAGFKITSTINLWKKSTSMGWIWLKNINNSYFLLLNCFYDEKYSFSRHTLMFVSGPFPMHDLWPVSLSCHSQRWTYPTTTWGMTGPEP